MATEFKAAAAFKQRITKIKGLSDRRRLPRLGSIRLGLKALSKKSGKEYPVECDFFICPPEVQAIYGEKPKELDVMMPLNDLEQVFPVAYKWFGTSKGLKCSGDGETAWCINEETKEMEQRVCPCENLETGKCKQSGTLMVMLPKVSVGGVYQIRTSSFNSIIDINSGLDYVAALLGRFALVPLKLRRIKTDTFHDEKRATHYTLQIIFDADITTLNALRADTVRILEHPRYQLPAPVDENPAADPIDIVVEDEEAITVIATPVEPAEEKKDALLFDSPAQAEPKKDFTKMKAIKGHELGAAVRCPELPKDRWTIEKKTCNDCAKSYGCPAWPEEKK